MDLNLNSMAASIVPKRLGEIKSAKVTSILSGEEFEKIWGEDLKKVYSRIQSGEPNSVASSIFNVCVAQYGGKTNG